MTTSFTAEPTGSDTPAVRPRGGSQGGTWVARLTGRLFARVALCLTATFLAYCLASYSFDPLAVYESRQPRPPQQVIDAQAARLGLDQPVPLRFFSWLGGVLTGDFGTTVGGREIGDELWTRTGTSLRLYLIGATIAVALGIVVGVRGALSTGALRAQWSMLWTLTVLAVPVFVLGTVLKMLWLPINDVAGTQILYFSGERTAGADFTGTAALVDRLQHLVLPTICIALPQIAFFSRYQRAAALDVANSGYVRAARARGLPRRTAFWRHGLRSAVIPVVSLFAFSFGIHLAGGVFTERIFGWYGLGDWIITAIHDHDARVCASVTLLFGVLVVLAGWISDLASVALDPRLRANS
ncbi:MAG: ABC transporter permease [Rhodococcus sp. (in: high G+C Gram-positive bacteria)]|uniref:ABC transporter permease n=1 Tax=Rhodococcus sp. EPR-157 TaxID=1813677 RepID=UPI0009ECC863|nr:ABC transporter permease [Rhodococcus sp. EPR-157]